MNGEWAVSGYRHVRELSAGATGRVVLAVAEDDGDPAVVKYLAPGLVADEGLRVRLREEARLLSAVEHPSLVRLYRHVTSPRGVALVSELVNGLSLEAVLKAEGKTTPEAALVVFKATLQALSAAHRAGVLHRDVKPGNLMIDAEGAVKLTDFGLATRDPGTPAYRAPELWAGGAMTTATDLYAATAVFYECLTGEQMYAADGPVDLARAHRSFPIPVRGVPASLVPLVAGGLAKDPDERPPSASAMLGRLESLALGAYGAGWEERGRAHLAERGTILALLFPLAQPLPSGRKRLSERAGARRGLLAIAGALALLLGATAVVYAASGGGGPSQAAPPATRPFTGAGGGSDPAVPEDQPTGRTRGGSAMVAASTPPTESPSPSPKVTSPGGSKSPRPVDPTSPPASPSPTPTFGGATAVEITELSHDGPEATARVRVAADGKGQVTLTVRFFAAGGGGAAQTVTVDVDGETTVEVTHTYGSCPEAGYSAVASATPGSAPPHQRTAEADCPAA